jgi:hypothetical protein
MADRLLATRPDIILEGHFKPESARRYVHVPFHVPEGIEQVHIRYDYSDRIPSDPDLQGGNTLDFGLFDERGIEPGGPGFRGWSGSAKQEITVGTTWATPPYRPGRIHYGEWNVLIGPYKIGPRGLDYRVEIWFNAGVTDPPRAPVISDPRRPRLALAAEEGWVRADLHAHSIFSDGDSWPDELIGAAMEAGLDVVGITDHNGAIQPRASVELGPNAPILIPGVEVTTYGGHWNAWSADAWQWYEFREPNGQVMAEVMARAVANGALVSVNHPKPLGPEWTYHEATAYHAVEIWNGWWQTLNTNSLAYWDRLLRAGRRPVAIGGSDTHYLKQTTRRGLPVAKLGYPTTWIQLSPGLEPSPEAVLDAIRAGRTFVTSSPKGPQLYLSPSAVFEDTFRVRVVDGKGNTLVLVGRQGIVASAAIAAEDWGATYAFPDGSEYVRAQVMDQYGTMLAVSNPVWRIPTEP